MGVVNASTVDGENKIVVEAVPTSKAVALLSVIDELDKLIVVGTGGLVVSGSMPIIPSPLFVSLSF